MPILFNDFRGKQILSLKLGGIKIILIKLTKYYYSVTSYSNIIKQKLQSS